MRTLEQALQDHELIVLRVLGEWWELDLMGADKVRCVSALAEVLAQLDMTQEINFVSPEEKAALQDLIAAGGQLPVAAFSRKYGEVRMMGPAKLEREEPWFDPESAAESLWYRGFLYRAFDETADGVMEFYYLPAEMMAQFSQPVENMTVSAVLDDLPALSASAAPERYETAVTDAVDDLTTLLAIAQTTSDLLEHPASLTSYLQNGNSDRLSLLMTLADEMGLLRHTENGLRPTRTAVSWLQLSRETQLQEMANAWSSSIWNDLCHTPGLRCEGEGWNNDPLLARTALLENLERTGEWYSLKALVVLIKETDPDFQRPDGNYDTWYVRDLQSDAYVRGFSNWDLVEGRLLHFLVQGPLFWLGMIEKADSTSSASTSLAGSRFRLSNRGLNWLKDTPPSTHEISVPLVVQADGTILVPHNASRYQRFRAARVGEMQPVAPGQPYAYRLTPRSLIEAQEQGIQPDRVLSFLEEASDRPLPISVKRAISRWQERGVEGRMETAVILRVKEAAILETLRNNPKTRDLLGESLGDLAVIVRPDAWQELQKITAELGLLLDANIYD
ncbi:MAG: helicase-associated domain-containing protein [Anaerolineae bacterium]|nr:helicase-associated domain-containing protein [Anaerolineae bacterium]